MSSLKLFMSAQLAKQTMINSTATVLLGEYAFVDRYGRHLEAYINYGPVKNIKNIPKKAMSLLEKSPREHIRFKVYEYSVATGSHLILDWADVALEKL